MKIGLGHTGKQHQPGITILNLVSILLLSNAACAEETMSLKLTSTAFDNGAAIPVQYTCKGANISPPLAWSGIPDNTRSLVLIVDDPDAPDPRAPKRTWVHWVLYELPPDSRGLPEGIDPAALPSGTQEGLNDWGRTGYSGPCPPIGRHRYFFKLYALDTPLDGLHRPSKPQVEAAMRGHVLDSVEYIGTYQQ